MKKILYIFLISFILSFTAISCIYAEDDTTTVTEEGSTLEEGNTEEVTTDETTLSDSLGEEEETDNGITVWTVLAAILGISLFFSLMYYIVKNFNL